MSLILFAYNGDTKERLKAAKEDTKIYNTKEEEIDGIYDIVIKENGCYPPVQKDSESTNKWFLNLCTK